MSLVAPTSLASVSSHSTQAQAGLMDAVRGNASIRAMGSVESILPSALPTASGVEGANLGKSPNNNERLKGAARDFEAVFLRQMLSCLERTTKVSSQGRSDAGQSTYGSMIVDVVAEAVAKAGGLGLADVMAHAMDQRGQEMAAKSLADPATAPRTLPDKNPPNSRPTLENGGLSGDVRISPQGLSPSAVPRTEIRASAVPIKGPLADRRIR